MSKWILILSLTLSSWLGTEAASPMESRAKVKGTIVQYQTWMLQIDASGWAAELEAMRRAGITTVVLQWLQYDHDRFYPSYEHANDPTAVILSYADKHGMKIYLGLDFRTQWWQDWDDAEYLKKASARNAALAKTIFARYGKHASFSGWYIPQELSDYDLDDKEIAGLSGFVRRTSDAVKAVRKLPVLVSTFFSKRTSPAAIQTIYAKLLKGSGIDILLVQDGVGAQGWATTVEQSVVPYLKAFAAAARENHIALWGILETFTSTKDAAGDAAGAVTGRVPAPMSQLSSQIRAESPLCETLIMFDFFHYMSPRRGPTQKALYDAYLSQTKP